MWFLDVAPNFGNKSRGYLLGDLWVPNWLLFGVWHVNYIDQIWLCQNVFYLELLFDLGIIFCCLNIEKHPIVRSYCFSADLQIIIHHWTSEYKIGSFRILLYNEFAFNTIRFVRGWPVVLPFFLSIFYFWSFMSHSRFFFAMERLSHTRSTDAL